MGNTVASGIQCEIRDRGIGDSNVDKRLQFFLIDNHALTSQVYQQNFTADQRAQLLRLLDMPEEDLVGRVDQVESSLAMIDDDQKAEIDDLIKSIMGA